MGLARNYNSFDRYICNSATNSFLLLPGSEEAPRESWIRDFTVAGGNLSLLASRGQVDKVCSSEQKMYRDGCDVVKFPSKLAVTFLFTVVGIMPSILLQALSENEIG